MTKITKHSDHGFFVAEPSSTRLDAFVAEDIKSEIISCVEDGYTKAVIDLKNIQFVDSSGIGMLVSVLKRMGDSKNISLCNMHAVVKSMFSLSHMDRVFQIHDTQAEAVNALSLAKPAA